MRSLAELNAVLQQYNLIADRGGENSRIYEGKGLVYRIIDNNKQKVGVPVKASLIYNKPTLKNIEVSFERNDNCCCAVVRSLRVYAAFPYRRCVSF